jgi:competence protein ComEC
LIFSPNIDLNIRAFSFLPRSIGAMTSVSAIITFALFTGGGATTVRASIMAIIGILAIQYARRYSVHRSLLLAAVVMALHNPYIVLGDPGFQLSFVATLGLLYISPLIEKMLGWVPGVFQLRSILATTTATQMSVLPLLVIMTGEVSVVSLLANALVLPIVAPAMALSALTAFLSWMGAVALPLYVVTHYALAYMLFISEYFGTMSHATIPLLY